MKIIDILNKIANNEEVPKKIKYNNKTFEYWEGVKDYHGEDICYLFMELFQQRDVSLNDEVEIIEEDKKIEKLDYEEHIGIDLSETVCNKINEIIDYINKE